MLFLTLLLCACQKSPEKDSIVSKNDGSFDINVIQSATDPEYSIEGTAETEEVTSEEPTESPELYYESDFTSTDGTVNFSFGFEIDNPYSSVPVVEVIPHFLTENDVERIAYSLFGNEKFYEAEPMPEEVYSKAEIQEKIERLLAYNGSVGIDNAYFDFARKNFIEEYTLKMETAPDENPHNPCSWKFRKSSYYNWTTEEYTQMDTSQDNDMMQVRVKVDDIPYLLTVVRRDKSDYKLNSIRVTIDDGVSPLSADMYIFRNRLCQTSKPDITDIEEVSEKAMSILEQMELGEWEIDQCYVETANHNEQPEYMIVVNAVPTLENVACMRRPQLTNLKSKEVYASNYYLTDAQFKFNRSGRLIEFKMYSPIDIDEVINEDVNTLSFEEIFKHAEKQFSLSDYYEYDYNGYIGNGIEEYACHVNITRIDYGLTRVKVPDTDESYYYVPAMIFWGKIQFLGRETGAVYDISVSNVNEFPLLILNAIDGSVINTTNG